MGIRDRTPTPLTPEPLFRVSHLFRDPVLRAVFAAGERDDGPAPVLTAPRPRTLDGGAARVLELA